MREDEIAGKTLGVVGLGAIGNRLAALAKAFGMRVVGTKGNPAAYQGRRRRRSASRPSGRVARRRRLRRALCCPLKPETTGLIGAAELQRMKSSAYLVNVSRGQVVVEADLIAALQRGDIAGAALDLTVDEPLRPDSPLWELPNVLITPHTGGETSRYEERLVDIIVENVRRWERDEPFIHQITEGW